MIVCTLVITLLLFGGIECDKGYGRVQNERFFIEKDLSPVVLIKKFENNEISTICTGTIIHRRRVLTAGRCLVNEDGNLDLTNIYVWSESIDLTYGGVNKAESALIHSNYTHSQPSGDVAILTVKGEFSPYIIPIILSRDEDIQKNGGTVCKISGWEDTSWSSRRGNFLMTATEEQFRKSYIRSFGCGDRRCKQKDIKINSSNQICEADETNRIYEHTNRSFEINDCSLDFFYVPVDLDKKMLGGPIICSGVQYGILSVFFKIGANVTLGGGPKISNHLPWIDDILRGDTGLSEEPNSDKSSLNVTYKFPPVVSIYIIKNDKKFYPICTGTMIHKQIILTTACCVTDGSGDPIQTGLYIRSGSDVLRESNFHKPSQIVLHPKYNFTNRQYNIALLKVDNKFNDNVEIIKLGTSDIPKDEESSCGIFGWRESDRFVYSLKHIWSTEQFTWVDKNEFQCATHCKLHNLTVNRVPDKNCSDLMIKMNVSVNQLDDIQFCVNARVYDTCNGQLGEPVICSETQYGIVTRKVNCLGKIEGPIVVTKIGNYVNWIKEIEKFLLKWKNP